MVLRLMNVIPLISSLAFLTLDHGTLAHINYPSLASESEEERERRIRIISEWNAVVAYCPRASAFFGHPHANEAPHPWREFLARRDSRRPWVQMVCRVWIRHEDFRFWMK